MSAETAKNRQAGQCGWRRRLAVVIWLLGLVGCGSERISTAAQMPALVRTAESRADIAVMLTDMMVSEVCDQVRGRFLPIGHTTNGEPGRGNEPAGGRWWVRDCRAQAYQGQVALYLSGVGWAWAEGSDGFGVRWGTAEYAFFNAAGTVVGFTDMSFDADRRIAWLQFRPSGVPYLSTGVTNRLEAHGNLPGKVVSVFTLGLFSGAIDDRANDTARMVIAKSFERQISSGFIVTFDVTRRQRDLASFGLTEAPLRPFNDGVRWLVNERQVLHPRPGGVHVNGPFAATHTAGVDFRILSGALKYRVECEREVATWFEPMTRGSPPVLPAVTHAQAGIVSGGSDTRHVAAGCPWYLITEPASDEVVVADVRVRADVSGHPVAGP